MDVVLGGTNLGRYSRNNVTFPLDANRNPMINLDGITVSATGTPPWGAGPYTLMVEPAQVLIDSTTPFLWLPESACRAFEQALGLTWNSSMNLYLLDNETIYSGLVGPNLSFTFRLTLEPGSVEGVEIVIPFSSLDMTISWPYVNISSTEKIKYFPLKRASSDRQYTLGRSFLQEAYLAVDYDRGNFSVHPAIFPPRNDEIEKIIHPNDVVNTPDPGAGEGSGGLSTAATVGIAVGIGLAVVAALMVLFLLYRRKKKQTDQKKHLDIYTEPGLPEVYGGSAKPPYYSSPIVEAAGEGIFVPRCELATVNLDPAELDGTGTAAPARERFSWEEAGPSGYGNSESPLSPQRAQRTPDIEMSPVPSTIGVNSDSRPISGFVSPPATASRPHSDASPISPASRDSHGG
jgi:hypothetical protein